MQQEQVSITDGRKRPRRYLVEDGDRVYLDQRQHVWQVSPKAQHIQDLLAGVAKAVSGDHTTDLARLLRLPGTLNRKDQRNGREPILTELLECETSRKYPISAFESFIATSPTSERQRQIAAMPLPSPRRISPSKADKLAELIAASAIAQPGNRSEADFAVCCYAVRSGIAQDEVWSQLEKVGKFAEQGRRYFDVTWANAEFEVRATTYSKLQRRVSSAVVEAPCEPPSGPDPSSDRSVAANLPWQPRPTSAPPNCLHVAHVGPCRERNRESNVPAKVKERRVGGGVGDLSD